MKYMKQLNQKKKKPKQEATKTEPKQIAKTNITQTHL